MKTNDLLLLGGLGLGAWYLANKSAETITAPGVKFSEGLGTGMGIGAGAVGELVNTVVDVVKAPIDAVTKVVVGEYRPGSVVDMTHITPEDITKAAQVGATKGFNPYELLFPVGVPMKLSTETLKQLGLI